MEKTDALKTGGENPQNPEAEVNSTENTGEGSSLKPNLNPQQQEWLNRVFIPNFRTELTRTLKINKSLNEVEQKELEGFRRRAKELDERELASKGEYDELMRRQQQSFNQKLVEIEKENRRLAEKLSNAKIERTLLDTASKYNAINSTQVMKLLKDELTLDEKGELIVVDEQGQRKMNGEGGFVSVDGLMKEFFHTNPHLVKPGAGTRSGSGSYAALRPGRAPIEPVTGGDLIAEGLAEEGL